MGQKDGYTTDCLLDSLFQKLLSDDSNRFK